MSDTDDDLKELEKEEKELARRRKKLEEQEEKEKKGKNFRFILIMIFLILLLVLILVLVLLHSCGKEEEPELSEQIESTLNDLIDGKEGEVELITESVLQSAVKNATLYTAVYPYNGVTPVYDKDGEGLKYYVSYKGTIKAGINSNDIRISLDEKSNTIVIRLPQVELFEPAISGEFDYIFMDQKYNTGDTYNEAFTAATADLQRRILMGNLDELLHMATESARLAERALVEPLVKQVDPEKHYTVKVLAFGEEE